MTIKTSTVVLKGSFPHVRHDDVTDVSLTLFARVQKLKTSGKGANS
jgi:hypothetical protein